MSLVVVINGDPKFENGRLNPGGGDEVDRVQFARLKWRPRPTADGTMTTALVGVLERDASQGTVMDLGGLKHLAGSGRCGARL